MTSSSSATSLCNRALLSIGGKAFVSSAFPSDGSAAGNACNILYQPTYEQISRTAYWNCLSYQTILTLLGAAPGTPEGGSSGTGILPPTPYLYMYARPTNCLKARAIIPTFPFNGIGTPDTTINNGAPIWIRGQGQIPFQQAYSIDANNNPLEVILTNQSEAQLAYIVNQPQPAIWDSQFEAAFVASLAAFLVPALAMNIQLMNMQISIAERLIAEARASDGNEGSTVQDHLPDWIAARSGGSGAWGDCWQAPGWDNMGWPLGAP